MPCGADWTDEENELLSRLWNDGYSYGAIVSALRKKFRQKYNRNMVAGKRKRLRLASRPTRVFVTIAHPDNDFRARPKRKSRRKRKPMTLLFPLNHPKRDEILEEMFRLREAGKTIPEIAKKLNLPIKTISRNCIINGIFHPEGRREFYGMSYKRGDSIVKTVSKEEEQQIVDLRLKGWGITKIAKHLNRHYNTIEYRLKRHAAIEEYETG